MQNLRDNARNPLTPTMQDVDAAIYSEPGSSLTELDSGRIVAKPTPIYEIWSDPKQPRRAIPSSISMHSDGNPVNVPDMLRQWHLVAETAAGQPIDIVKLLNGQGDGLDADKFPSVAQDYLSLVRLAQSIKADGLINPITIIQSDDKLVIESGERRWLAYHLLNTYLGEQWAKIPAAKGNGSDSVWRQATENTARRALNAIGMARQLALLIMATRESAKVSSGSAYKDYEDLVTAGACDRRFYAQIADGNLHRIPSGMGERIQGAMGLSETQLARYRSLLEMTDDQRINDDLWTQADIENWAEHTIREVATLPTGKVRDVLERAAWTLDDLRALKDAPAPTPAQPMTSAPLSDFSTSYQLPILREWIRKNVRNSAGRTGMVIQVDGAQIKVVWDDDHSDSWVNYKELHFTQPRSIAPSTPAQSVTFGEGDTVQTRLGTIGIVKAVNGREILIDTPQRGIMRQNIENLTLVKKFSAPQLNEADIEEDVDPEAPKPIPLWREGGPEGHSVQRVNKFKAGDKCRDDNDSIVFVTDYGGRDGDIVHVYYEENPKATGSYSEDRLTLLDDDTTSDQAEDVPPAEPRRIIKFGSLDSKFLFTMQQSAQLVGDETALAAINDIILMTDVQAITLADAQTLKPTLDTAYDLVRDLVTNHFAAILQQVLNAAE